MPLAVCLCDLDFHALGVYLHVFGYHLGNVILDHLHHLLGTVDPIGNEQYFQPVFGYLSGASPFQQILKHADPP